VTQATTNPWLEIPLADYEGHMSLPSVAQAALIANQLEALITRFQPSSVAVIGCAGGNGFDRVKSPVERLVGVDINPQYIESAGSRYRGRIRGLELHACDIQSSQQIFEPVELIYAALVFEYVDLARSMHNLARHCVRGGVLATLVQLPHETKSAVTPSPYSSLQALAPGMRLVAPDELAAHATESGFTRKEAPSTLTSTGGKRFAVQVFQRSE
jgi:trans-aconitate methyltransferase